MHVGWKIAIGAGLVGGAALLLSACGNSEKDPRSYVLDKFGDLDDDPNDNKWTTGEIEQSYVHSRWQDVNTYRVGDYIFGTRQRLEWNTTDSMRRVFEAAKGNDAVLSLQELSDFSLTFDKDKNGTLSHDERRAFEDAYAVTSTRSQTRITHNEPFSRYSPEPDPYYPPSNSGGHTSPGDDGGSYIPPSNGGSTSPGDDGGSSTPPSNGGSTSPGDSGGSYTPPSGGSGSSGNSTDNGNPDYDDF